MKTIIRFQTCILAAGSDKRSKRSGSSIQVQRKQSIIVTFFTIAQINVYNTMCKFKVTKTEIKMGYMERDKTHQVLTFKSVY